MLRHFVQLVLIASLFQLHCSSVLARCQQELQNPFEPLSKSQIEPPSESTTPTDAPEPTEAIEPMQPPTDAAEVTPTSEGNPSAETEVTPAAEVESIDPPDVAAPDAAQVLDPATQDTQPIPLEPREDLLRGAFKKPYLIEINAPIDGFFKWYINKSLEQAKKQGADVVIIQLTTPGGELDTSLGLARQLLDINWAKTVIWIPEEAISGGAIMALGADAIYMKKSAMFGDAGPVYLTAWGDMIDAEEKIVSYTAEKIRLVAEESGRPGQIAAAMADRKLKVFYATEKSSGRPTYLSQSQIERADVLAAFEIGEAVPESGEDRFLTVGAVRAKQLMLCEEVFEAESVMLKRLSDQEVIRIAVTRTDRWVYALNRPWLTTLILIVGIICLYIEMTVPGVTLPGLISLLSFGLFFWSHILGGTAGGLEIMLFLLGTIALFTEIFVLPGFGVFGVAGIIMVGLSLLMATQDFLIPQTSEQWKQFQGNGLSILLAGIVVAIIVGIQIFWLDSIPGMSRFQLRPEELPAVMPATSHHPAASLERGAKGICQSDLRPSGKAMINGQLVDVLTEGDYVEAGTEVSIIRIEGYIITVRKVTG